MPSLPVNILNTSSISPLWRIKCNDVKLSDFSLSGYDMSLNWGIIFVARRWTFSIRLMSFCKYGFQDWTTYSSSGRTSCLYNFVMMSFLLFVILRLIQPNILFAFLIYSGREVGEPSQHYHVADVGWKSYIGRCCRRRADVGPISEVYILNSQYIIIKINYT